MRPFLMFVKHPLEYVTETAVNFVVVNIAIGNFTHIIVTITNINVETSGNLCRNTAADRPCKVVFFILNIR